MEYNLIVRYFFLKNVLHELKVYVIENKFSTIRDEIEFFKHIYCKIKAKPTFKRSVFYFSASNVRCFF